jgi:parallel beta-helix repeat protein
MNPRDVLLVTAVLILIAIPLAPPTVATATASTTGRITVYRWSHVLSTDGTTISALNTATGKVEFSGTDAAAIIMQAAVANSKVLIKAGTYIINHAASGQDSIIVSSSNVELYGEGNGTILRLANGANRRVLSIFNANNVYVHDLQVDGNQANQAVNTVEVGINGWEAAGLIVSNNYVHDEGTYGIYCGACTNAQILNNLIVNSYANGITIDDQGSSGPSGNTVSGNTVDGASDVGITAWYGNGLTATGNIVRNVMMNVSPYGGNDHVGMMVENSANQITYRNNTIQNSGVGFSTSGGTNLLFDSNRIQNCQQGMYSWGVSGLTVTNNIFNGIAQTQVKGTMYAAFDLDASNSGSSITGNQFLNIGPYLQGGVVVRLDPSSGTFTNNIIHTNNGQYTAYSASSGWTIQNNTILP